MRRVVDCFKFCHELDMLELRLRILEGVVDYFVITEAPVTHSGKSKPLFFEQNKERFSRWADRIRHVVVDDMPLAASSNYERDRHQLDSIFRGVPPLQSSDVLIVGDLDEIPNPNAIRQYKSDMGVMGLQCYNGFLYINCEAYRVPWYNPKIVSYGITKRVSPSGIRDYFAGVWGHFIPNGGWHFSYCGGLKTFEYKLQSYSHSPNVPPSWKDEEKMKWIMKDPQARGEIIMGRALRIRRIDASFPDYVRRNQTEMRSKNLIWTP
jgi:beta-1,4-mannosyl-glycoprotein beta-1,4-N-acetylglucosaminyltransferase